MRCGQLGRPGLLLLMIGPTWQTLAEVPLADLALGASVADERSHGWRSEVSIERAKAPEGRSNLDASHFANWIGWAKGRGVGLDFTPTCFSHPKAGDGFTLSHADKGIRKFWIEHCRR